MRWMLETQLPTWSIEVMKCLLYFILVTFNYWILKLVTWFIVIWYMLLVNVSRWEKLQMLFLRQLVFVVYGVVLFDLLDNRNTVFLSCWETSVDEQKRDRYVGADISQTRCSSHQRSTVDAEVFGVWCTWCLCLSDGSQRWTSWLAVWQQGQ